MMAFTGIGLYSPKQAEKLIGIDARIIRRWLLEDDSPVGPLWHPEPEALGAKDTLSFKDLLELQAVRAFRKFGVSMPTIRRALANLSEFYNRPYPLTNPRLATDGKSIFLETLADSGEECMADLAKRQSVFREVIKPSVIKSISYDASDNPICWRPDENDGSIIVDPARAFGKPLVLPSYMPTRTLYDALKAENGNAEAVARYYEITSDEVIRAANFEKRIAAGEVLH
jgi:uncharacterized protein (DUF433 family)